MGHSAKITRGGDKTRVNQHRHVEKLRAQGAKSHSTTPKEALGARCAQKKKKSQAISTELRSKAQMPAASIVNMAPKLKKTPQ